MPIFASKINFIKGTRLKDGNPRGLKVDIELTEVKAKKDVLEIGFAYLAKYDDVAEVRVHGAVLSREESAAEAEKLVKAFKEKKMDLDFFKQALEGVNYVCGVEAAFVAVPLELNAPLRSVTPRMHMQGS